MHINWERTREQKWKPKDKLPLAAMEVVLSLPNLQSLNSNKIFCTSLYKQTWTI
jgi:hypothetical protein